MSPPMAVTEDTPADMLAGSMDLHIVLPSGQVVRTSVQRSTPMMDLLVQVTTAHRLSPGSHSLQAMGERGALPFKPSTPIGALDTFTVRIVQKRSNLKKASPQIPDVLPHTFRLQIHLPRSQLFVMRVTPQVHVSDVLKQVCKEKDLDPLKYELRKTASMNQPLGSENTLGELQAQELTLVVRGVDHVRPLSSADIMHLKQANNRQNCDSSLSSGSLGSRSVSPIVAPPPQPPQRKKRRPAPKPPENQMRTVVISHSRESSDSSGYHEPSTLSESPTHNGPPSDISSGLTNNARNSASMSNLTSISNSRLKSSVSVSSLSSNGTKKKRAPPPPPILKTVVKEETKTKSMTLPADMRHKPEPSIPPPPVELAPSPPPTPPDLNNGPLPKPRLCYERTPVPTPRITKQLAVDDEIENLELPPLPEEIEHKVIFPVIQSVEDTPTVSMDSMDWQYQLPPPPTHFRDIAITPTLTEVATVGTLDSLTYVTEDPEFENIQNGRHREEEEKPIDVTDSISKKQNFTSPLDVATEEIEKIPEKLDNKVHKEEKIEKAQVKPIQAQIQNGEEDIPKPIKVHDEKIQTRSLDGAIQTEKKIAEQLRPLDVAVNIQNGATEFSNKNGVRDDKLKILNHKSNVMNELTNVLSRTRIEKSQSFSNLSSAGTDGNKVHIMAPISNFSISNYEPRMAKTAEDVEFKKPMNLGKKVRRADSMNVKRINLDKEELQQHFLEFLMEKDIPVEFDDVTEILPKHVVKDTKVETKEPEKEEKIVKKTTWVPPAISMGTWGERPKTKITIKDEDYTTEVIVPEKRPIETKMNFKTIVQLKPVDKKPITIKKPTNYEIFSALSRRDDLEEEKKPPIICGVELKKEFQSEPDLIQGLDHDVPKIDAQNLAKVRLGLMPVVKGFRLPTKQQSLPETKTVRQQESQPPPPIPPPMVILRPAANRTIKPKISNDPRSDLLEQIRSFGGFNHLRKTVQ